MKRAIIISSAIIVAAVVFFFSLYFIFTAPKYAGNFSVDKYTEHIQNEHFQTDKNYGKITDYKSAAKAGKTAIFERFEHSEGSIFKWRGCYVQYDKESDAYFVYVHHFVPFMFGDTYAAIIQSDGTILAIWGEK